MSVLAKLTLASVKRNKKRSIVTMLGVALSVALLFTVIAIPTSFWETLKSFQKSQYGDFHQSYEHIPGDKVNIIENAEGVESVYYAPQITYDEKHAYLENSTSLIPIDYYQRVDTIDNTPDKEYIVFVRYKGPLRKSSYARPMHERYNSLITAALDEAGVKNYYVRTNESLLMFDGNIDYNTSTIFVSLAALMIGLVVIASIFTIRNSFSISTTERTREFGMLSSIGATPGQIRRSVVLEALIIGVFAIPVGLAIGAVATLILLQITSHLLGAATAMVFFVPFWALLIDVIAGFIIVWLASASAAIRASRLSPIEAIRSTQDISLKSKKLKTSKIISSYFGVGGVIASKNLKRSRKKYRTTVISIVVSVAIFVGLSSFVIDGQRIMTSMYPDYGADYVSYGASIDEYKAAVEKFKFADYVYYQSAMTSKGYKIAILSSDYFEKYARSLGVNGDFEHVAILDDYLENRHSNGSLSVERATKKQSGETLSVKIVDSSKPDDYDGDVIINLDIKITKITDKKPVGTYCVQIPTIFVSEKYSDYDKLVTYDTSNEFYTNPGDLSKELSGYFTSLNEHRRADNESAIVYFDIRDSKREGENIMLLLAIFMYGFIAVVALIGVTNIFNTITTNVQLRAKEFAMLKSIGMTDTEFNRMVRLESLLYSLRALIIGLPIGILISYVVHAMLAEGGIGLSYELPLIPIVIAITAVALLITVIMRYSVRQVSRQNIIETIRQDTV